MVKSLFSERRAPLQMFDAALNTPLLLLTVFTTLIADKIIHEKIPDIQKIKAPKLSKTIFTM